MWLGAAVAGRGRRGGVIGSRARATIRSAPPIAVIGIQGQEGKAGGAGRVYTGRAHYRGDTGAVMATLGTAGGGSGGRDRARRRHRGSWGRCVAISLIPVRWSR